MYKIITSVNRDSLDSFFPICINSISFSCFADFAEMCISVLNKNNDSEVLPLSKLYKKMPFDFPIRYDVGNVFVIYSFYYYAEEWLACTYLVQS